MPQKGIRAAYQEHRETQGTGLRLLSPGQTQDGSNLSELSRDTAPRRHVGKIPELRELPQHCSRPEPLVCRYCLRVLFTPMLVDRIRHLDEPGAVLHLFDQLGRGKKLDGVGRGISERPEEPGGDQDWNVMQLTVQHPRRLLRREAGRQLPK